MRAITVIKLEVSGKESNDMHKALAMARGEEESANGRSEVYNELDNADRAVCERMGHDIVIYLTPATATVLQDACTGAIAFIEANGIRRGYFTSQSTVAWGSWLAGLEDALEFSLSKGLDLIPPKY